MSLKAYSPKNIWTLILNDWKRFWVIAVVEFLALFFSTSSILLMNPQKEWREYLLSSILDPGSDCNGGIVLLFPIIVAVAVFSYLHSVNSMTASHSLPISREEHFIGHVVSGYLLVAIPIIANGAILAILSRAEIPVGKWLANQHSIKITPDVFTLAAVGKTVFLMLLVAFVTYSYAVLAGMLTGTRVLHCLASGVLVLLVPVMVVVVDSNLEIFLKGYCTPEIMETINEFFFPVEQISSASIFKIVGCIILSIAILIIAYIAYKKRLLECATEPLAYKFMEPFLVGIFSFIASSIVGEFFISYKKIYLIGYVIGFLISYFLLCMICEKSTRVFNRRNFRNMLITLFIFVMAFTVVDMDILGYGGKKPNFDEISSVKVDGFAIKSNKNYTHTIGDEETTKFISPENIENTCNFHEDLYLYGKPYSDTFSPKSDLYPIIINYRSKTGHSIKRCYYIDTDDINTMKKMCGLKELYESDEFKKQHDIRNYKFVRRNIDRVGVSVWNYDVSKDKGIKVKHQDKIDLLKVIDKDYRNRTFEQELTDKIICEVDVDADSNAVYRAILESDINTINWLREHNYLNASPTSR